MGVSTYIANNSARGFPFLHIFSSINCFQVFEDDHSDWHEVMPYYSFDLHFSNNEQC